MMEPEYKIEKIETQLPVQELLEHYYDQEQFETLCRECGNYGNVWSCPPYSFSPRGYLEAYQTIRLFGTVIRFAEEFRAQIITREQVKEAVNKSVWPVKEQIDKEFLALEKQNPGSRMLSSGGCQLCTRCARTAGMPCRQKGKMRYSLESLGCNVAALAEQKLGVPLLWSAGQLPEYYMLVNGLLCHRKSGESSF